ncbi:MAG: TetR/AcrR family transcriptional regulator [Pseudomonadota bacterium]
MTKRGSETLKKRSRKSPAQARADILKAAEDLLIERGPDGLKLVEIAERAGISHSSIIHHFGSIANLLGDLALEISDRFSAELEGLLDKIDFSGGIIRPIVDLIFDVYACPANTKLISWLFVTDQFGQRSDVDQQGEKIAALLKHRLVQNGREHLATPAMISGIQTTIVMSAIGDSIGRRMLPHSVVANLPDDQTRQWVADLITQKLEV